MKYISIVLCAALALVMLAGCGDAASGAQGGVVAPVGSDADYKQVIEESRPAELNDIGFYNIVTGPDDIGYDLVFDAVYGFVEADMQRYAISIGGSITLAYGVAIILPQEGREQAVQDQVNNFVKEQQNAQENYLPDQYEIAKNAIVKVAPTGEVVLAMCEGAETVMSNMLAGLAAGAPAA